MEVLTIKPVHGVIKKWLIADIEEVGLSYSWDDDRQAVLRVSPKQSYESGLLRFEVVIGISTRKEE